MPDAYEVQIADAVVAELNSSSRNWVGPAFTAERLWLPVYEDDELATLKVAVVPLTIEDEQFTRELVEYDYGVVVDLQQLVSPRDLAAIDALSYLAQQIADWFKDVHHLETLDGWRVVKSKRADVFDVGLLHQQRTWETVIALAVKGQR